MSRMYMLLAVFIMRRVVSNYYRALQNRRHEFQIYYDAIPFEGLEALQVMKAVTRGERPPRLNNPPLNDDAWKLVYQCWAHDKRLRPEIGDVVKFLPSFLRTSRIRWCMGPSLSLEGAAMRSSSGVFPLLLTSLNEVLYVLLSINALRLITASHRHAVLQWLTKLPLILPLNCWIYLTISSITLN